MKRIEELLNCDQTNAKEAVDAISGIHSDALQLTESWSKTWSAIVQAFGDECEYTSHQRVLDQWAKETGIRGHEAIELLDSATLIGSAEPGNQTDSARVALRESFQILARIQVAQRIERDYLWGLSDLLRLRITSAWGYERLQAESAGVLRLLAHDPNLASEWFGASEPECGRKFYSKYHPRIVDSLRSLGLEKDYRRGSHWALHSGVGGSSLGRVVGGNEKKQPGEIRLSFQEAKNAWALFIHFGIYLRAHRRILDHSSAFFPELSASQLEATGIEEVIRRESKAWEIVLSIRRQSGFEGMAKLLAGES